MQPVAVRDPLFPFLVFSVFGVSHPPLPTPPLPPLSNVPLISFFQVGGSHQNIDMAWRGAAWLMEEHPPFFYNFHWRNCTTAYPGTGEKEGIVFQVKNKEGWRVEQGI